MIHIINSGVSNIGSVQNMLKKIGVEHKIALRPEDMEDADKILLPGVGSFDAGIKELENKNLGASIKYHALEKKRPILGICLGMQLLLRGSEEGELPGLGLIEGEARKFKPSRLKGKRIKVPHMGWNVVKYKDDKTGLFSVWDGEARFYFVHSYYASLTNEHEITSTCFHGIEFVSSFQSGNIFGAQFHPEKSHKFGMQFLKNFAEY